MHPNKASLLPLTLVCSGCLALGVSAMSGRLIVGLYVLECAGLAVSVEYGLRWTSLRVGGGSFGTPSSCWHHGRCFLELSVVLL